MNLDLREMKEKASTEAIEEPVKLTPRVLTFSLTYNAPNGKTYQDTFESKVMDGEARLIKGRVFSQLMRGMTLETIPLDERLRLEAISRTVAQLVDAPDWFNTWCVQDVELLKEVNDLLLDHENRFLYSNHRKSKEGETEKRISLYCPALEKDELTK